jgi:molybdopterin-binding protein
MAGIRSVIGRAYASSRATSASPASEIEGTSIQNTLPASVVAIADDTHPALALVHLDVGGATVIARVTHRSAAALELRPGLAVWAQIKAVALIGKTENKAR